MSEYIFALEREFEVNENPSVAIKQKAYMKGLFDFYGLSATRRRELTKPFLEKDYLPARSEWHELVKLLWQKPQRDYQAFAVDLSLKYIKQLEDEDIELFEYMVLHKSWWDTVDMIANKLMGAYFKQFPKKRAFYVEKWLSSGNMWLQRSALLFQLKYKTELDTELLKYGIVSLLGSKEFFINKAIGWVLREYSRTNPRWVSDFVEQHELSNLSKREALRLMK